MKCDCCLQEYEKLNDLLGYCDNCSVLINTVEDCLSIARSVGVPKYGPSLWRNVSIQEHLEHASKHVYAERKLPGILVKYDHEDHLAHAICRLVMVRALQNGS